MPFLRPIEYFTTRFHEKQEQAWLGYKAGRDLVLDYGRRSGKSELEAEIMIEDVEDTGFDSMYCAISQKQAREIFWPKLDRRLKDQPHWKPNHARLEWSYKGGPKISLKGTDEGINRLRGDGKRIIVLDECSFYRHFDDLIKEVCAPMLADYNGQLIYSSTPKGRNHFYKLKQKALANPHKYFTNSCTMFENPFISEEGRKRILEEYSGANDPLYRQEVLCEYIDFQGKVFALDQAQYVERIWNKADITNGYVWRGLDHGYSPDPTACVWLAFNKEKKYWQIFGEYKRAELLIHKHASVINQLDDSQVIDTFSDVDPQVIAEYNAVGLYCTPAHKYDKEARLLRIVTMLRTGQLKIASNCVELLDEIDGYEWGQDGKDHLIDAMIYAVSNAVIPVKVEPIPDYSPNKLDLESVYRPSFGDEY